MSLSQLEKDLIALDEVETEVTLGLACWEFVLDKLPSDDEVSKTIKKQVIEQLANRLPNLIP